MEIALDVGSMATDDGACCMIEVMGRSAGWIAGGAVLAKRAPMDAPHIVLLPEVPLDQERFLAKVRETISAIKHCVVVVGEVQPVAFCQRHRGHVQSQPALDDCDRRRRTWSGRSCSVRGPTSR